MPHLLSILFYPLDWMAKRQHARWLKETPGKPRNPFTTAVLENDVAAVRAFLESGQEVDAPLLDTPEKDFTEGGRKEVPPELQRYAPTALDVAAQRGYIATAQVLLEFGADVNRMIGDELMGESALHFAAYGGSADMVALLLHHGALLDYDGKDFEPPLIKAASAGNDAVVTLLLEHGADINQTSSDGETPLMAAVDCRRVETVRILIEAGAEINARDQEGRTALWWAKEPQIIALLRAVGARK